jgi:DUF1680 family protein
MPSHPSPVIPSANTQLEPLSVTDVTTDGGFWGRVQQLNRDAIIPHCDASLERVGWLNNFRAAARGTLAEERVGRLFTDSELYKTMEAMAWESTRAASPEIHERLEALTTLVEAAQAPDGYLNTFFGWDGGPDRWSDLGAGHELYCAGHLIQAAVAVARAGGPESFVQTARRFADLICDVFGEDGLQAIDGHPEIETALVELYRLTGERRYLDQAKLFVDRRGHHILPDTPYRGRDYYQDDTPVRDGRIFVGHAVRALYLAAGAVDVAVETGDTEMLDTVRRQYDATLQRRTYLHGGMGSNHRGESFGDDFELPSERAYAETCAAVASIQLAWRLLLATGEERYADVIERTLYNAVLSAPSLDGTTFFYVNALQRRELAHVPEPGVSLRRTDGQRASWFTTSCCPTNFARLFASLTGYTATTRGDAIQIHQYQQGTIHTELESGNEVKLGVRTGYPIDGKVEITVEVTDGSAWELGLRIPGWSPNAIIRINGEDLPPASEGLATLSRNWALGDVIELDLDMSPRVVRADPRVDALRSQFAVERGPIVYCAESVDQPDLDLDALRVDPREIADRGALAELLNFPVVTAEATSLRIRETSWPYQPGTSDSVDHAVTLSLIPYFLWANRGLSTMRVWLPEGITTATA